MPPRSFPISVRINGSDNIEGGLPPEEVDIIAKLVEEAGVDLINISGGVNGSYPLTIAPFYAPPALYADIAARVKQLVRIPVSVGGRIEDMATAEWIVHQGKADLVLLGACPRIHDQKNENRKKSGECSRGKGFLLKMDEESRRKSICI